MEKSNFKPHDDIVFRVPNTIGKTGTRSRADFDAWCDFNKSYRQILADIHEESNNPARSETENLLFAQKRMASLVAKAGIAVDRLVWILIALTVVLVFLIAALMLFNDRFRFLLHVS